MNMRLYFPKDGNFMEMAYNSQYVTQTILKIYRNTVLKEVQTIYCLSLGCVLLLCVQMPGIYWVAT